MSYRHRPIAAALAAMTLLAAAAVAAASSDMCFPAAEEIEGEHPLKIAAMAPKYINLNSLERRVSKSVEE